MRSETTTTSGISVTDNTQSSNDALNGSKIIYIVLIAVIGGLICIILFYVWCMCFQTSNREKYNLENVERRSTGTIDQHE